MQGEMKGAAVVCGHWKLVSWHFLMERSSKLCPFLEATTLPLPFFPMPAAWVQHRYFFVVYPLDNREPSFY